MSSLVLSNNHSERMMALSNPNYRVIVLDDEPQKYLELINGEYKLPKGESICSVLLPPPETTEYFIEGDYEKSEQIYNDYLFYNPNVNHLLATIFTLLFQNISVMIFIPQDADRTWGSISPPCLPQGSRECWHNSRRQYMPRCSVAGKSHWNNA